MVARGTETLGREWNWLGPLARRYLGAHQGSVRPRQRDVVHFLRKDRRFRDACEKHWQQLTVASWLAGNSVMQPVAAAKSWPVPPLESVGALASWLGVNVSELEWFADARGTLQRQKSLGSLGHYNYHFITKKTGSVRLVEAPKPFLKRLQRQILESILDQVPIHAACHGFVQGRSILSFAEPHAGKPFVLRMDLKDFFPSIGCARVQALFRTMGYPESVADLLGGLCTTAAPRCLWHGLRGKMEGVPLRALQDLYGTRHLPQGAPTSPALANLCAYRLDCRLAGFAKEMKATYTRYADDLAFSGGEELRRCSLRFSVQVGAIALEEGFAVNFRKTRAMGQSSRQHLAGLVVNQKLSVAREDFDRLKAILTNCVRHGAESQNREAHPAFREHLLGRVGFVAMVHPARGARLRALWDRIDWIV